MNARGRSPVPGGELPHYPEPDGVREHLARIAEGMLPADHCLCPRALVEVG